MVRKLRRGPRLALKALTVAASPFVLLALGRAIQVSIEWFALAIGFNPLLAEGAGLIIGCFGSMVAVVLPAVSVCLWDGTLSDKAVE